MGGSAKVIAVKNKNKLNVLYFGGQKSGKLVRCYWKGEVNAFRVELELHRRLLRDADSDDDDGEGDVDVLSDLVEQNCPLHLQFVKADWKRLKQYLVNRFGERGLLILATAKHRATSIGRLREYLRRRGIPNPHRFFVPLKINKAINRALSRWIDEFEQAQRDG